MYYVVCISPQKAAQRQKPLGYAPTSIRHRNNAGKWRRRNFFWCSLVSHQRVGCASRKRVSICSLALVDYRLTDKLMKGKQVGAACETEPPVEGVYQRVATELRGKTGVVG